MEADAARAIGAGIACLGMGGAGIGLGVIFGNYLAGALRNPSAADGQFARLIFGFAVTEALGIFSLLVGLLLLFVVSRKHGARAGPSRGAPRALPWHNPLTARPKPPPQGVISRRSRA